MKKTDDILSTLNPVQREAVEHVDGPLLLLAGAGSGKTRVLTHKVAYLLKHKGVSPLNILAVTFTNKAAEEMRNRLDTLVGLASKLIWICTFHAACVKILRRDIDKLGYGRDFTIFDTSDQLAVMRKVMEELQLSERSYNPRSLLGSISNAKNVLIDHVEYANSASSFSEQITSKVYREYQAYLKENNALDFDDLIMFAVNLFQKCPEVLEFYQEKFRYILVDEYQDTNHSQYVLTKMLAAKHKNICVVGDDDQCLPAGTFIRTPYGEAKIEDLKWGDLIEVASGKGKICQWPIAGIYKREYNDKLLTINTKSGLYLRATPNHLIFVRQENASVGAQGLAPHSYGCEELEWVDGKTFDFLRSDQVRPKMQFAVEKDGYIIEDQVENVQWEDYEGFVYDLDVDELHNYIANGVVVHNSIYSWRGADIRNILDFEKDYQNVAVMRLEQNYRSTQNILDAAWNVVKHNRKRKDKKLWTQNDHGDKIIFYQASDEKSESDYIAQQILDLKAKGQLSYRDFAVFYRVNAQSRALEEGMIRAEIPYAIVGSVRFYERKEVKDTIAYLRVIANKNESISLRRIINVPPRRIGKETLDKLESYAKSEGFSLYEALKRALSIPEIKAQTLNSIAKFIDVIESIDPLQKPSTTITEVLEKSGYLEMLKAEGTIEAESRMENVKELTSAAVEFEARQPEFSLPAFLENIVLASDVDQWESEKDRATLMTLHSAKGLEFAVVFISGMEEGLFPHQRSFRTDNELEEERRLCYVGITRSKKLLYLSCASERLLFGYTMSNLPSRFIDEIPQNLIQVEDQTESGQDAEADYQTGDLIRHPAWGDGEILEVFGKGLETIVKVRFDNGLEKSIMVEYAKIEKLKI